MPISRSAKKSLRKSITNRKSNLVLKNKFKAVMKKFLADPSAKKVGEMQSMVDKAVKKGIIHKNKAQLSKKISKIAEVKVVKKTPKKKAVKKISKKMA
jgi:small subunit ribosomal protein S20